MCENSAVLRRYGDKYGVGDRISVFQLVERDDVWIVFLEMIPNVHIDRYDVLGARCEG